MAHGDFKDLARRTTSDEVLGDKAFDIVRNPKYDGYQRGLSSIVYKCFNKKTPQVVMLMMEVTKMNY